MVVCESEDIQNQFKNIVTTSNEEIVIKTPKEIRHSITIVGLPKEYHEDKVIEMLTKQNGFIRKFATANIIEDHIKVHVIKPLRNNASCFQAFCTSAPFS